jgi:hypothetical protein
MEVPAPQRQLVDRGICHGAFLSGTAAKATEMVLSGYQDNRAMMSTIASMGCQTKRADPPIGRIVP